MRSPYNKPATTSDAHLIATKRISQSRFGQFKQSNCLRNSRKTQTSQQFKARRLLRPLHVDGI